jgi:hypothetical protein
VKNSSVGILITSTPSDDPQRENWRDPAWQFKAGLKTPGMQLKCWYNVALGDTGNPSLESSKPDPALLFLKRHNGNQNTPGRLGLSVPVHPLWKRRNFRRGAMFDEIDYLPAFGELGLG